MEPGVTHEEAQAALDAVRHGRQRVVDEIDLPQWYWWGLAGAWIVFGLLSDLASPWVASAATMVFGIVHASVAGRVLNGRHRTRDLSVSATTVGRHVPALVIAFLVVLVLVTIAAALAMHADGARHPSIIASVLVAALVPLAGPQLLAAVRRRAARAGATA
jgi:hypothetical protein